MHPRTGYCWRRRPPSASPWYLPQRVHLYILLLLCLTLCVLCSSIPWRSSDCENGKSAARCRTGTEAALMDGAVVNSSATFSTKGSQLSGKRVHMRKSAMLEFPPPGLGNRNEGVIDEADSYPSNKDGYHIIKDRHGDRRENSAYMSELELFGWSPLAAAAQSASPPSDVSHVDPRLCMMETCFDFSRCQNSSTFSVYVPPVDTDDGLKRSSRYAMILAAARRSRYTTRNASAACVVIPSVDTLDRDKLSESRVPDVDVALREDKVKWRGGTNHILFNLYSGTWPDYEDVVDFDTGRGMLVKASLAEGTSRARFDLSLPLVHNSLPQSGGAELGLVSHLTVPSGRKRTIAFKGKRYLVGIGSKTRTSLFHLHNDKDVVMVITCRHGTNWEKFKDERCDVDNEDYDRYDYTELLENATFCLVPRGRRLGSYRFLEVMQYGCIPVLLSNNFDLPFSEVIHWNDAVIWGDEDLLLQVTSIVRSIGHAEILRRQQQVLFLWDTYFSTFDKIINTALEILKDRVFSHTARSHQVWNQLPGAHANHFAFSRDITQFPFTNARSSYIVGHSGTPPAARVNRWKDTEMHGFTALIHVDPRLYDQAVFHSLLSSVLEHRMLAKVIVACYQSHCPQLHRQPRNSVPVIIKIIKFKRSIYLPMAEVETRAVLSLEAHVNVMLEEVDLLLSIWSEFPESIVGLTSHSHFYDGAAKAWRHTSKSVNEYSMINLAAALYHRYYNHVAKETVQSWAHSAADAQPADQSNPSSHSISQSDLSTVDICGDFLINMVAAGATKKPPIKVTRRQTLTSSVTLVDPGMFNVTAEFEKKRVCFGTLIERFGYMPLVKSKVRLDPALYMDNVARWRKRYAHLERRG